MRALATLALAGILTSCGTSAPTEPAPVQAEPAPPAELLSSTAAVEEADARRLDRLVSGLASPRAADRQHASLGLARLHDPAALPHLLHAIRDPNGTVRENASLGLAGLGRETSGEAALLAALATEPLPTRRALHLVDLGRAGGEAGLLALTAALAADSAVERAAACHALAAYGQEHVAVPPDLMARVAARTGDDTDRDVRIACAHAVLRLPASPGLSADLGRALGDADPEVRAMVVRALGHGPDTPVDVLAPLAADADWDVVLQAVRALSSRADADGELAAALEGLYGRASDLSQPRVLGTLLGALEGPTHALARTAAVHRVAEALLTRTAAALRATPDLDHARLHCAAARLVDLSRGWPSRVERCGGDLVPEPERARLAAEILGALSGAERERTAYLIRLSTNADVGVREATATALGTMDETSGRAPLSALAGDADLGVVVSALDAIARRAERAVAQRDAAELAALLGGASAGVTLDPWPDPATLTAVRAATDRFREEDDLEGLITALGTIAAAREGVLSDLALGLALHHNLAVRAAAATALDALDLEPPEGRFAPPPNPLHAADLPGEAPIPVEFVTSRGSFVMELRPDWAPTTVARILGLIRIGFYDGLTFHRVVPAFVVQGGDPRGDGYGGPGWAQRCEDNRVHYERGIVGMALAGRDTGGSQFFVTLTSQPHLDGRYTAFARVTQGMEVVERITRGDVIVGAREVSR